MRGQILSFDDASGAGLISGDDGIRYSFVREAVSPPSAITTGLRVDFVPIAGEATNIMLLAAPPVSGSPSATPGVPTDSFDFKTALFSFQGRLRRQHFWIGWVICFVAGIVAGLIPIIGALLALALLWPNLAIMVKRLHDMGQSGWLAAIPIAASVVGGIAIFASIGSAMVASGGSMDTEDPAVMMGLLGPALGIIAVLCLFQLAFLIWVGVVDSQRGDNRFGPNPKGQ